MLGIKKVAFYFYGMAKVACMLIVALLICGAACAQPAYRVRYITDDSAALNGMGFLKSFPSRPAAIEYIAKAPAVLQSNGYITASVDSARFDSLEAQVHLFLGTQYHWAHIRTAEKDAALLEAVRWNNSLQKGPVNFAAFQALQQQLMARLEETGYPFAKIFLDSIAIVQNEVSAVLKLEPGPVYKIDSIRVYGDARIDNRFLQRYLGIPNGSIYNKKKLEAVSGRLATLQYVQEERPSSLTLLGTGSVLNLYLKPRRSSQINVLAGFLPNSNSAPGSKKFLITGEANVLLKNALSAGETIGLNWQRLQAASPRLNLIYQHPFAFRSSVGLNLAFDMFRKDSSFLNVHMKAGADYAVNANTTTTLFVQKRQTIVNTFDTTRVKQTRKLPQDADVAATNLGITYSSYTTDYRLAPRTGIEATITAAAGTKKIKKNNQILELKDVSNPSYKFESLYDTVKLNTYLVRINGSVARYMRIGKNSVLKTGISAGFFSSGSLFRNELFLIGGAQLLRGFDEESQFVSQYVVPSVEYRHLIGLNSYFLYFIDGGWARHPLEKVAHTYIGTGAGLSFETKAGIFNIVWAVGKRDDVELNLRQSKVHLGFVNYF
jgi:outer membrane protein assembly factor BamA